MSDQAVISESDALRILAYLTASADTQLFEPDIYGPFRLVEAGIAEADGEDDHCQPIAAKVRYGAHRQRIWEVHPARPSPIPIGRSD